VRVAVAAPPDEAELNIEFKGLDVDEQAAKIAQLRQESMNKLKHIAIAMQNYHAVNKHFPPAIGIGPDGKTQHSWRVAILPYLDEELAKRYRLNEPWDSEHNKQVIADGAKYFNVPSEEPADDCGYFVLIGPSSVFYPADKGTGIRMIPDGTSKTIGVVEAKRAIPWTKPEDIEFSADKPLPKLGGFFEGGFNAMGMDAAAHFLPADIDEAVLRALITKDGRERVGWDDRRLGLQKESE